MRFSITDSPAAPAAFQSSDSIAAPHQKGKPLLRPACRSSGFGVWCGLVWFAACAATGGAPCHQIISRRMETMAAVVRWRRVSICRKAMMAEKEAPTCARARHAGDWLQGR